MLSKCKGKIGSLLIRIIGDANTSSISVFVFFVIIVTIGYLVKYVGFIFVNSIPIVPVGLGEYIPGISHNSYWFGDFMNRPFLCPV